VKIGAIITAVVAAGALSVGTYAFLSNASPYVTAKVARERPGVTCNVAGELVHETVRTDIAAGEIRFELKDESGETLPVVYKGAKPGNFDSAPKVSVMGVYRDGVFHADRILVKCPSKYESKGKSYARNGS
jgi:cytochrome c-type biogenesis protein CcmE